MANYTRIASFILKAEAGPNDDPNDLNAKRPAPGPWLGPRRKPVHTNRGVSWGTFADLARAVGYSATGALFKEMPLTLWSRIFKTQFWDKIGGDKLESEGLAYLMADYAYGSRPEKSVGLVRLLLRNLGHQYLPAKGGADAAFLAAVNGTDPSLLITAFVAAREARIRRSPRYAKGWQKRLNELKTLIGYRGTTALPASV